MAVEIKKVSTDEENISARSIWFEVYVNGRFETMTTDVIEAMNLKEAIENGTYNPA